jgi:oligopeptide/dipeptide ABC transporter ATP-binding protein
VTAAGGPAGADRPVLEVRGLTVRYGGRLAASDVTLALGRGEVLGVVGESGAGKSTVGRAVVRLLPEGARVEAGSIRFGGRELLGLPERAMRRLRGAELALIPQDPLSALNPAFRLGRQSIDALRVHRGLSRRAAESVMVGLLQHLGIADAADVLRRYPHELSGGMRQRVLIAMAFSCEPSLVVADEPTTALDVTTQAQILRLLEDLRAERGAATLFVTHDLAVVAHLAHQVAVMYAGCVVEVAPTATLFRQPAHPYTEALLAQVPRVDRRAAAAGLDGHMPVLAGPPAGCPFRDRCPRRLDRCETAMPAPVRVAGDHVVACHLHREAPPAAGAPGASG